MIQHAGEAVAIQIHELIALPGIEAWHFIERMETADADVELAPLEYDRRARLQVILVRIKRISCHPLQMSFAQHAVTQAQRLIFQQQAADQPWFLAQPLVGEVVKHQYLLAQTQVAQLETVRKA